MRGSSDEYGSWKIIWQPSRAARPVGAELGAIDRDAPGFQRQKPENGAAERRLPASAAAHQRHHLAPPHLEIDAGNRERPDRSAEEKPPAGMAHREPLHRNHRIGAHRRRARGKPFGERSDQAPRVRLARCCEQPRRLGLFHQPASAQHHGTLGIAPDEAEIVGDQQHRRAVVARQPTIRSSTSRWLSVSSAVVGSSAISSFGLSSMTRRQHDALAHAARELMRPGAERGERTGDAHPFQHRE